MGNPSTDSGDYADRRRANPATSGYNTGVAARKAIGSREQQFTSSVPDGTAGDTSQQSHYGEKVGAVLALPDRARHAAPLHFNNAAPVYSFQGLPGTKQSEVMRLRNITSDENSAALPSGNGSLEIGAASLIYDGPRVLNQVIGRDVNPMGRADGMIHAGGMFAVANEAADDYNDYDLTAAPDTEGAEYDDYDPYGSVDSAGDIGNSGNTWTLVANSLEGSVMSGKHPKKHPKKHHKKDKKKPGGTASNDPCAKEQADLDKVKADEKSLQQEMNDLSDQITKLLKKIRDERQAIDQLENQYWGEYGECMAKAFKKLLEAGFLTCMSQCLGGGKPYPDCLLECLPEIDIELAECYLDFRKKRDSLGPKWAQLNADIREADRRASELDADRYQMGKLQWLEKQFQGALDACRERERLAKKQKVKLPPKKGAIGLAMEPATRMPCTDANICWRNG